MARPHPDQRPPHPGERVSLRRVRPDGEPGDLIGFVLAADADGLRLRDRRGTVHEVAWADVRALRTVGVARGRDPRRAPREELDRLADAAGVAGAAFVARVSDLLDPRSPTVPDAWGEPPPCPAVLAGEWVTTGDCHDLIALARWATRQDARSIQVRTDDPTAIAELLRLGFTALP